MTSTNTFRHGQKDFLSGDLVSSIRAFSLALEEGDHPFHSHLNRGIAYLKIGRFDQAIEDFDAVIKEDDKLERAFFYRGIAQLNLERNKEAIHDLNRCLAINPERGSAYVALGLAHAGLKHWAETEKNIHDCHALNSVELGEFLEEYALSDHLFNRTLLLFAQDEGKWKLSLTEDEVQRLSILH